MIVEKRADYIRMSINNDEWEEVLFLRLKSSSYSFYPFEYYLFWNKNSIILSEAAFKSELKIEDDNLLMRIRFGINNRESLDKFFNLLDKTFPFQDIIESWNSLKGDIIISELKG